MKPFNLQEAKEGKPVCIRSEELVTIYDFNLQSKNSISRMLCKIRTHSGEDISFECLQTGKYFSQLIESQYDLFMAPIKKEGWINIYYYHNLKHLGASASYVYESKDEALKNVTDSTYLDTIKIEWEE